MNTFKAAVVQAGACPFDTAASVTKAVELIHEAGRSDARLIVFPEAFRGCYPKGCSFAAPVGMRTAEGRETYRAYFDGAVKLDGDEIASIASAAQSSNAFVVMGCIERDGATLYCTALYIDGASGVVGKHRKLMPTAGERLIWGFGDGSTMTVIDTSIGKIAAAICWENYMPMLRMFMYSQGVELYCAPTADDRDTWIPSMQHIAIEGRCFVFTACQYLKRASFPTRYLCALGDDPNLVLMRGGSAIINPFGRLLAGPYFEGETILYADIDMSEIVRGKFDFDAAGHYARPDVFALTVNVKANLPVSVRDIGIDSDITGASQSF